MAVPFALMATGTALQVVGGYVANYARAQSEAQNALLYREQAEFARAAMMRELAIAARENKYRESLQISAAAKGGADISGSVLNMVASTAAQGVEELMAIKKKGELDIKIARLRGNRSEEMSQMYGSAGFNLFQAGGTLLTNLTNSADTWGRAWWHPGPKVGSAYEAATGGAPELSGSSMLDFADIKARTS